MLNRYDQLLLVIGCTILSVLVVGLYLFSFASQNPGFAIAASILLGSAMIALAIVASRK